MSTATAVAAPPPAKIKKKLILIVAVAALLVLVVRRHRTVEAEAFRADADPETVSFAAAGVVVVQTLGDTGEGVGLLPDSQLGDAQHGRQRALAHSRARSRGHSQTPEIRAHRPGDCL